jgi:hypothetical protein
MDSVYCASIKSRESPTVRCPHKRKQDSELCVLHSRFRTITKYVPVVNAIEDNMYKSSGVSFAEIPVVPTVTHPVATASTAKVHTKKTTKKSDSGSGSDTSTDTEVNTGGCTCSDCNPIRRGKVDLSDDNRDNYTSVQELMKLEQEREQMVDIKTLLFIRNNPVAELVGPAFDDLTQCEDDQDPVAMNCVYWTMVDGKRCACPINKYFLFSYIDSKGKIRCLSINTVFDMINNSMLAHPMTQEEISPENVTRARKMIAALTKINYFETEKELGPQKIRSMTLELFHKFGIQGIVMETPWFTGMDIYYATKLNKDLQLLVKQNLPAIDPVRKPNLFNPFEYDSNNPKPEDLARVQAQLLIDMNELLDLPKNKNNTLPYYIILGALSNLLPVVKERFPELQWME